MKIHIVAALLCLSSFAYAQSDVIAEFDRARTLYKNGMYAVAREAFSAISASLDDSRVVERAQAAAYDALCAVAMDDPASERVVTSFLENVSSSPDATQVRLAYGRSLFDKGLYDKALSYFVEISDSYIYETDKDRYLFEKAYCRMMTGNWQKAEEGFTRLLKRPYSKYSTAANYYLGYSQYRRGAFRDAVDNFNAAVKDPKFETIARYYLVESMFMLGDNEYVLKYGPVIYSSLDDDFRVSIAKVISEAYYAKGDITAAKQYFDYYRGYVSDFSRKDYYLSGIISSFTKDYQAAAESFSAAVGADSLGQNAWYHLADTYLQQKNKKGALDAFKSASDLSFDQSIREDAYFNYAKLAFDVNGDIAPFNNFMTLFPSTEQGDVINNYIATAYIVQKDYQPAIDALRKIRRPNGETQANLQRAAYFRAMEFMDMGSYSKASEYLNLSLDNPCDSKLRNRAYYWLGECEYRAGNCEAAIALWNRLANDRAVRVEEFSDMIDYNLGYAYLKNRDYQSARYWFDRFVSNEYAPSQYMQDAKVRLADTYFMQKDYVKASELYSLSGDSPYALYQSALSYGLAGDNQKKIDMLTRLSHSSPDRTMRARALYETGRTCAQVGDDLKAEECFSTLLDLTDDSNMVARALLELGLLRANKGDFNGALSRYKTIVERYRATSSYEDALSSMESIYQTTGRTEEYFAYLDRQGLSSVKTEDQKEAMLFESAEQKFLSGNTANAASALQSFLKLYPGTEKAPQAHYYLAETYRTSGRLEAAAEQYFQVMLADRDELNEPATLHYAQACYELARYEKAAEAYETLAYIAGSDAAAKSATAGKMRSYYRAKQYQKALSNSDRLLSTAGLEAELKEEARYIGAKSNLALSNSREAMKTFALLARDKNSEMGAEAAYILIKDQYDAGNFDEVEKLVYEFSDAGSPQTYWLAKSFIVLGDSFADRENYRQAEATFQSIKEGYSPVNARDDVMEQVELRLEALAKIDTE